MNVLRALAHLRELADDDELPAPASTREALRRCVALADRIPENDLRELAALALDCWRGRTAPTVVERFAVRLLGGELRTA